jgi:phosphatidylinositol kinase/protein kinase (PI-3  family)
VLLKSRYVNCDDGGHCHEVSHITLFGLSGFIENQVVPFPMTPNVEALIGKAYVEGRFIPAFAMIATAVREHQDQFDPILRLYL